MDFFSALWIIWIISEILLTGFMRAKKSAAKHDKSSLKILWLTISLSVSGGILLSKTPFILTDKHETLIYYAAIFLISCGLIIRWLAILKLRKSFTVNLSVSENQLLIRSGIYKYIRHPSYSGSLLSFLGLAVIFNNPLTGVIIFIPILISFLYRLKIEEALLKQVFGNEYTEYSKNSWKLVPKIF